MIILVFLMNCFKEDGSNVADKATSPDSVSVLPIILSFTKVLTSIGNNQQSSYISKHVLFVFIKKTTFNMFAHILKIVLS